MASKKLKEILSGEKHRKNTWRHHFYSAAELKANAVDPLAKRANARIYEFEVVNPDPPVLQITPGSPHLVDDVMYLKNLFTFDKSGQVQKNFEKFFEDLENRIDKKVTTLEHAIGPYIEQLKGGGVLDLTDKKDLDLLLFSIWRLKFLNFVRNPYCIKKVLNSFPRLITEFSPTTEPLRSLYNEIASLSIHDIDVDLNELGISLGEFKKWLQALFLVLLPSQSNGPNGQPFSSMLEEIAHDLMNDPDYFCSVGLHALSQDFQGDFLVSDRGFQYSLQNEAQMIMHFNVTRKLAMTFMMIRPDTLKSEVTSNIPQNQYGQEKAEWDEAIETSQKNISGTLQKRIFVDDRTWTAWFNEHTIFQAKSRVYCGSDQVLGTEKIFSASDDPDVISNFVDSLVQDQFDTIRTKLWEEKYRDRIKET